MNQIFFVTAYYSDQNGTRLSQDRCEQVYGPDEIGRVYLTLDAAERAAEECAEALREDDVDGSYGRIEFEASWVWHDMPEWATEIIDTTGKTIAVYSVAPTDDDGKVSGEYKPASSWDDANRQDGMIRRTNLDGSHKYQWVPDGWYPSETEAVLT